MPNLSVGVMQTIPVMLPPLDLQQRYSKFAGAMLEQCSQLKAANERLSVARDLLLPRLISGQLDLAATRRELETAA